MRVALLSQDPYQFALLDEACRQGGHECVGYGLARSRRYPPDATNIDDLRRSLPPSTDLWLVDAAQQLAPLMHHKRVDAVASYCFPWKLPRGVIDSPRLGVVNIHTSLLPRYRGPMPVHWAVRNGDATTGVTAHLMDEEFDTGNIVVQRAGVPIPEDVRAGEFFAHTESLLGDLLLEALAKIERGDLGTPQDRGIASYAGAMEATFRWVNWAWPARAIHNQVRTFAFATEGRRGPLAKIDGDLVEVLETRLVPGRGQVADTGDGPIWIINCGPADGDSTMPWISGPAPTGVGVGGRR